MPKLSLLIILITALLLVSHPLHADTLDKFRFLKVSEQEGKAVIKGSDGKLRTIGVGDVIEVEGTVTGSGKRAAGKKKKDDDGDLRVLEIVKDRITLEQQTPEGPEKIIIRLVNGKQSVERVTKTKPRQPAPMRTVPTEAKGGAGPGK